MVKLSSIMGIELPPNTDVSENDGISVGDVGEHLKINTAMK